MHGRGCLLLALLALGCGRATAFDDESPIRPEPAIRISRFKSEDCGTIQGKVHWQGALPKVAPLAGNVPTNSQGAFQRITKPNPNAPFVDDATSAVRDAVVFLRGVDPERSKPWDLRQVGIELEDMELRIRQGNEVSRVGFVETGKTACVISRDSHFHSLRARGADFFSLPQTKPQWSNPRRFEKKGLVELSSGAGYIWMHAYLFVDDHPYYSRTSQAGAFVLTGVPVGEYELVCWMPNWHIQKRELDPESSQPSRILFHPPLELIQKIRVSPRQTVSRDFFVGASAFKK